MRPAQIVDELVPIRRAALLEKRGSCAEVLADRAKSATPDPDLGQDRQERDYAGA
jgi:hypothetical protein